MILGAGPIRAHVKCTFVKLVWGGAVIRYPLGGDDKVCS